MTLIMAKLIVLICIGESDCYVQKGQITMPMSMCRLFETEQHTKGGDHAKSFCMLEGKDA